MLKEIHITNYVLIERLDIAFNGGFSVLTGETGAGKSIILGALGLLLGGRADTKAIRQGTVRCTIEGHFSITGYGLESFFKDNDLDFIPDDTILRRELTDAGKSRAFINDTPVSLTQLKELGSHLIDIHSQHQNLALGTQSFQLDTVDAIAANKSILEQYHADWKEWTAMTGQLEELKKQAANDSTDLEYIRYQLDGIQSAGLQDGEQEELEQESEILEHAEDIKQDLFRTYGLMEGESGGAIQEIKDALQSLRSASGNFPQATELAQRTESCLIELRDIASTVDTLQESVNFDPAMQDAVNERLDLIYSLEKKHRKDSIAQLLQYADELKKRLDNVESYDDVIRRLTEESTKAMRAMEKSAAKLSDTRKKAAAVIERQVSSLLVPLGIPNVRFCIELQPSATYIKSGHDSVRFMFSANKSVPMQDIAGVASGGEIARVMLTIKSLVAGARMLPTIIFDEIDTGVSGAVAEQMAMLMRQMSAADRQVLAITHLPQIAALGHTHYKVFKTDDDGQTRTSIRELACDSERIREIAAMMSGATLTDAALENAKTLIENGR